MVRNLYLLFVVFVFCCSLQISHDLTVGTIFLEKQMRGCYFRIVLTMFTVRFAPLKFSSADYTT